MIRRIKKKAQTAITMREELTEIFLRLRKKYADLLLDLQQLIEPLLPPSYRSPGRQNKTAKNITFLP